MKYFLNSELHETDFLLYTFKKVVSQLFTPLKTTRIWISLFHILIPNMNMCLDWSHMSLCNPYYLYGARPMCCWERLSWQSSHLLTFYNHICVHISNSYSLTRAWKGSVLVRDSIPGRVRRAAVCHEAISQSHMMHTIHMFYSDNVNKHVFCGARKASEHLAGNCLHFYWLNAHCTAEKICSLISIEPVPLSLYFTYETLLWVLMRCM